MRITIYGQRGDGPVLARTVSMLVAKLAWRQFFMAIVHATADSPVIVGDMRVWSEW